MVLQIKGGLKICCCSFLLWLTLVASSSKYSFPIARNPNCGDQCGNVSIPFPFGTSPYCFLSRTYLIICNYTFNPPKPFLGESKIEITDISLDGHLKIQKKIARACYDNNQKRVSNTVPTFSINDPAFTVNTANKFTIVGCNTYGYISGKKMSGNYQTGCMAFCSAKDDLTRESACTGVGCCQIPIPGQVSTAALSLDIFSNFSQVLGDSNNCNYAFLAENNSFTFSPENLKNLRNVTELPMVLDWAIGNGTCEEARANASSYACRSNNSKCYKPDNGYGYHCSCVNGYEGNPYLQEGCIDIDECKVERPLHNCSMLNYCVNTPGDFTCRCPNGYHGDGRKGGNGCSRGESLAPKLATWFSLGAVVLLLSACLLYFELRRRKSIKIRQEFFQQNGGLLLQEKLNTSGRSSDVVKIFSELELNKATDNFHNRMIIGQGGYGTVFKATLADNRVVAIKKSKVMDETQVEQFINEIYVLSQINHRNVVKILGCCLETQVPLLVYEFISNGTLFQRIHNEVNARYLSWDLRLKIATETAGVLSYLHSAASPPIIHRDVKSANILLDHTDTAKVSDFGTSRLIPSDESQLSTMVQGTFGYLDPEYMLTSQLTEKSDVYSFGVVLLELLTGLKPLNYERPEKDRNLANLFLSAMKNKSLFQILDSNVRSEEQKESVIKVAMLAKSCLKVRGEDRPSMKEVALELEGLRTQGKHHSWDQTSKQNEEEEDMYSLLGDMSYSGFTGGSSSGIAFDSLPAHSSNNVRHGR